MGVRCTIKFILATAQQSFVTAETFFKDSSENSFIIEAFPLIEHRPRRRTLRGLERHVVSLPGILTIDPWGVV